MLSLRAPGRAPLQQPLEVRAGKTTKVEVSLGAGGFAGHEPEIGNNVEPVSSLALDPALAPWLLGAGGVTAATAAGLATTWFALLAVSPCQASSLHDQELRLCETQAEAYARGAPQMGNDAGRPEFGRTFKETLLVSVAWGAITSAVLSGALLAAGALAAMSPRGDNPLPTDEEINASSPTKEPVAAAP